MGEYYATGSCRKCGITYTAFFHKPIDSLIFVCKTCGTDEKRMYALDAEEIGTDEPVSLTIICDEEEVG